MARPKPRALPRKAVRNDIMGISLLSSVAIHICVILLSSVVLQRSHLRRQDFVLIRLVDLPRAEAPPPPRKVEVPPVAKKPAPPAPNKVEQPKAPAPLPPPIQEEPAKVAETKPLTPAKTETPESFVPDSHVEGGGSEAGTRNLLDKGDVGVVPGIGTAGGGGTAASGLGRGSGAPGLSSQTGPLKTNREAKPIQNVRAAYPLMALRMGIESDVQLKVEVDAQGKVTKAEVIKSGGAGFDEEALKAVKQSRFEPAQRDGRNVAAEFTYVYRFRLQR